MTDFWEERRTDDGRLFYYNTLVRAKQNNKIRWVKPTDEEEYQPDWREQVQEDGSVKYVNIKTDEVSDSIPEELQEFKNRQAAILLQNSLLKENSDIEECEEGQITDEVADKEQEKKRNEEIKRIYIQLFQEVGVSSTWKWDDFHRMMRDDDRYNIIKAVGQKKQIFNEYLQKLKKKDREEARLKKQAARENFIKMLSSSGILRPESKYYRTAHLFQSDPRWRILEEKERDDLFQDYLDELEKKDREKSKEVRKQQIQQIHNMLSGLSEVDHTTKWAQINKILANNGSWQALDQLDQLTAFSEYIIKAEEQYKESKRLEKRTRERKNREAFREMLQEHIREGNLTAISHWRTFLRIIKDDQRYLDLVGQPGSTPKELFDDFVSQEREKFAENISRLREYAAEHPIPHKMDLEEYRQAHPHIFADIPEEQQQYVFTIVQDDTYDTYKEQLRKYKKSQRRFQDFLRNIPNFSSQSTFDMHQGEITENITKYRRLNSQERIAIFTETVEQIREEELAQEIEPGEIPRKIKKREHKKHRRSEDRHKKKHKHSRSPSRKKHKHKKKSPEGEALIQYQLRGQTGIA